MYVCPQCATSVDLARIAADRETCPDCGVPLRHEAQRPWMDVARVTNLAEAGFLTDELVGLGIDAQIYQADDFSAVTGHRGSQYLIRVPSSVAREAAAQIRQHLSEDAGDRDAETPRFRFPSNDQPIDPLFWRPVAVVILAGVASFVLGQRFSEQNDQKVDRRPPRNSLSSTVEAIGRPLVAESVPGQPRHRLSFDRRREAWLLETDLNGDGRYERRQMFQMSGAAW